MYMHVKTRGQCQVCVCVFNYSVPYSFLLHSLTSCVGGVSVCTRQPQWVCGGQRISYESWFSLPCGYWALTQGHRVWQEVFTHWGLSPGFYLIFFETRSLAEPGTCSFDQQALRILLSLPAPTLQACTTTHGFFHGLSSYRANWATSPALRDKS